MDDRTLRRLAGDGHPGCWRRESRVCQCRSARCAAGCRERSAEGQDGCSMDDWRVQGSHDCDSSGHHYINPDASAPAPSLMNSGLFAGDFRQCHDRVSSRGLN
jgi:hypothetical protein